MSDAPTTRDVFIQAVKDHLDGTPNAHHPVQFEPVPPKIVRCTLCHAAVPVNFQNEHRKWHDFHNQVHDDIMEQAQRHVPEPRFR